MAKAKAAARPAPSNVTSISAGRKPRAVAVAAQAEPGDRVKSDAVPAVIVFGLDESGKAHASRFGEADAELAIKAAGMMGYRVLRVSSPDIAARAQEVALGRIFASGRGFVPFCKMALYEALCGFDGAFAPPPPVEPEPAPLLAISGTPHRWEDITVGSLVLATVGDGEGWYEAVVAENRGEALFVLQWRDWPDDGLFVRRADGLALLPARPAEAPAAA